MVTHKLELRPFAYFSIGFNEAGPILDALFTLSSKNRDIIVNKVSVKISNADTGHTHLLEWAIFLSPKAFAENKPNGDEFSFATGQNIEANSIKSLCVRLADLKLNDKFLFKAKEFQKKWDDFLTLNPQDGSETHEDYLVRVRKAFNDANLNLPYFSYLTDNFFWKEGNYNCQFIIETSFGTYSDLFNFDFYLSQEESERLSWNKAAIINKRITGEDGFFFVHKPLH